MLITSWVLVSRLVSWLPVLWVWLWVSLSVLVPQGSSYKESACFWDYGLVCCLHGDTLASLDRDALGGCSLRRPKRQICAVSFASNTR